MPFFRSEKTDVFKRKAKKRTNGTGVNSDDKREYLIQKNANAKRNASGINVSTKKERCDGEQNLKMIKPVAKLSKDGQTPRKKRTGVFIPGCSSTIVFAQTSLISGGK